MIFKPANLFYLMAKIVSDNYFNAGKKRCLRIRNEGGSRSSKTYCFFYLLVWLCSNNENAGWHIYVYRDTLTNCRDFTLKDFQGALRIIGIYDPEKLRGYNQKPEYDLFGNMVYFRGLEDNVEYPPSQICFFNEAMEMSEESYKAASKRCTMLDVADWNPKYTDHWIFAHEGKPHTWFTHSTFLDNPYCDEALVEKYKSWCPWEFEDLALPEHERRPNAANIKNGTVDKFQWLVYGAGIRCAREGLIFRDVTYIDRLPTNAEHYWYGLDYANTVGVYAFAEVCRHDGGLAYDSPIYVDKLDSLESFYQIFKAYYMTKRAERPDRWMVICDSARPQNKDDLNGMAWADGLNVQFENCRKFTGCVEWRIDLMKRHKMYLVRREHIKREQENYRYKMVNGINTNEPEKNGFDHFFDAAGMSIQYEVSLR